MLHTIDRIVYWNDFDVYINSEYSLHENRHDCLYKDLTETIFNLLCYVSSRHRNVQFIHFEVRFEKEIYFFHHMIYFKLFLSEFVKTCSRLEAEKVTPYFFWCREKTKRKRRKYLIGNCFEQTQKDISILEQKTDIETIKKTA